jgi:phosphoribosylamine--glycine ligase
MPEFLKIVLTSALLCYYIYNKQHFTGVAMKVLIVGSGAREHALAWKFIQSKKLTGLYYTGGNIGISMLADSINIRPGNIEELCSYVIENEIDLTVVASETPVSLGIADLFHSRNLPIFAPTRYAAKIATSKSYAKKFMHKCGIPTPKFGVFEKENQAIEYARKANYPLVVKYDTHAANESSFICNTFDKAKKVIENCFSLLIKNIVIEEFIEGKEISFHIITDGYNAVPLPSSISYKKLLDGDGGINTPGMGAYAPCGIVNSTIEAKIAEKVIFPAIDALNHEGTPYTGFLNVDLILDKNNNIYVLEFNSGLAEPEAQTILPLIEDDLLQVVYSSSIGALGDEYEFLNINDSFAATVVLTSGGYPSSFKTGFEIEGLDEIDEEDVYIFHNATKKNKYGEIVTDGGRVLSVTAEASTLSRAHDRLYETIGMINFNNMKYRKDIAKLFIEREMIL